MSYGGTHLKIGLKDTDRLGETTFSDRMNSASPVTDISEPALQLIVKPDPRHVRLCSHRHDNDGSCPDASIGSGTGGSALASPAKGVCCCFCCCFCCCRCCFCCCCCCCCCCRCCVPDVSFDGRATPLLVVESSSGVSMIVVGVGTTTHVLLVVVVLSSTT